VTNPPRTDAAPPHSERSERVLLSGLLKEPDLVTRACIRHGVTEADLFFHPHRVVWRAVWDLVRAGVEPTLAGVYQLLLCTNDARELCPVNPALCLAELFEADPTGAWCDWACVVVLRCSVRRAVIRAAQEAMRDAMDGTLGTEEYASQLG
jgi:replicative DNA helicase